MVRCADAVGKKKVHRLLGGPPDGRETVVANGKSDELNAGEITGYVHRAAECHLGRIQKFENNAV